MTSRGGHPGRRRDSDDSDEEDEEKTEVEGCPIGLQYLLPLSAVFIQQEIEMMELVLSHDMNNKYGVFNAEGQVIYRANENSSFWELQCFCRMGSSRPFNITMFDVNNNCIKYDCPTKGLLQEVTAIDPTGRVLGRVSQTTSCPCCPCSATFEVRDAGGRPVFLIKSLGISGFGNSKFPIYTMGGDTEVGCISKKWAGIVQEAYTDADKFMVTFPQDLDARIKAVLIGACFLIDFMYFERKANTSRHRRL